MKRLGWLFLFVAGCSTIEVNASYSPPDDPASKVEIAWKIKN